MPRDSFTAAKIRIRERRKMGLAPEECKSLMKIVTCNLPELDLIFIDRMIMAGIVPSRSEYVRLALREAVRRDFKIVATEIEVVEGKYLNPKKFVMIPGYSKPVKIIQRLD